MPNAFILRFLEDCTQVDGLVAGVRLMTKTAIPREGDVQDAPMRIPGALGGQSSGTGTATKIAKEQADTDHRGGVFPTVALRVRMATQSHTLVAAEAPDKDRGVDSFLGIPQCF